MVAPSFLSSVITLKWLASDVDELSKLVNIARTSGDKYVLQFAKQDLNSAQDLQNVARFV